MDVTIPADRNVEQKEAEKKLKYKSLCTEIQRMWNLKCTIVPVIIGATGTVTRSLRNNLVAVPGKHSIDSVQKTAILGTSHTIRKVLQCEACSVSGGDHRWFKRSTGNKRLWQRYPYRIIIIIIVIGGIGIVTRSLRKNLEAVPLKHSIDSLQKTAILGT